MANEFASRGINSLGFFVATVPANFYFIGAFAKENKLVTNHKAIEKTPTVRGSGV